MEKTNYRFWESCRNLADIYINRLMLKLKHSMPNPTPLSDCIDVVECKDDCECHNLVYVHDCHIYLLNGHIHYAHYHLIIKKELTSSYLHKYLQTVCRDDEGTDIYATGAYKQILIPVISLQSQHLIDAKINTILTLGRFDEINEIN